MTRSAQVTLAHEMSVKVADVCALASVVHQIDDIGASIASGSFKTMGMIVAPCSNSDHVRNFLRCDVINLNPSR